MVTIATEPRLESEGKDRESERLKQDGGKAGDRKRGLSLRNRKLTEGLHGRRWRENKLESIRVTLMTNSLQG